MKEAIVKPGPTVNIVDSEIPKPGPDQVLIKVVVSGSNPKDWYANNQPNENWILPSFYIRYRSSAII